MSSDKKRLFFFGTIFILFILGAVYEDVLKNYLEKNQEERNTRIEARKANPYIDLESKISEDITLCGAVHYANKDSIQNNGYILNGRNETVQVQVVWQSGGEQTKEMFKIEPGEKRPIKISYTDGFYFRSADGSRLITFINAKLP